MEFVRQLGRKVNQFFGGGDAPGVASGAEMRAFYAQFIAPGSLCFDVGANYGNRVEVFLDLQARVVAVEPQEPCITALRAAYGGNARFTLVPKAIGASEGEAELLISDAETLSSLNPQWVEAVTGSGRFAQFKWERRQVVPLTTLDALIERHGTPSFIKIDVEGYEYEVVRSLSRPVEALSFEFVPEVIEQAFKCIDHLRTLGDVRLNYAAGEKMQLALPDWVGPDDMVRTLTAVRDDLTLFGDVYVRFADAPPRARRGPGDEAADGTQAVPRLV